MLEPSQIDIQSIRQSVEEQLQQPLHWVYSQSTASTNDDLLQLSQANAVAITEYQTQGRGQYHRVWQAQASRHILFSLSIERATNKQIGLLPIAVGVAICKILNQLSPQTILLKWPNDLYSGKQKLGGILVEAKTQKDKLLIVIGVGLNVYDSSENPLNRAYLSHLISQPLSRSDVIEQLIVAIHRQSNDIEASKLIEQFNQLHMFQQQSIRFKTEEQLIEAKCVGINLEGELILQRNDGVVSNFSNGSIVIE